MRGAPPPVHCVVFDAEAVTHVDSTGLDTLGEVVRDLRLAGIELLVARIKAPTKRRLDESGLSRKVGEKHFHPTVRAAVDACREPVSRRREGALRGRDEQHGNEPAGGAPQ